nr:unnamed protein product [Callosobruchus analis]
MTDSSATQIKVANTKYMEKDMLSIRATSTTGLRQTIIRKKPININMERKARVRKGITILIEKSTNHLEAKRHTITIKIHGGRSTSTKEETSTSTTASEDTKKTEDRLFIIFLLAYCTLRSVLIK